MRTNRGMVFGKNSDRPPGEAQVLLAHHARSAGDALDTQYLRIADPGAHALVGSHPTWLWGIEHGINQHGVAVGNEKIWTVDDPSAQAVGLLGMDLVRIGLERGQTADDALAAITTALAEHGQGGSGEHGRAEPYFSSFLIVDSRGGWLLETSARSWAARPVGDGAAISNRVSLTTDWTRASSDISPGADFDQWRAPRMPTSIADHRLTATRACIARPNAMTTTASDVVATLRDHGNGPWGAPHSIDTEAEGQRRPLPLTPQRDNQHITVCMHIPGYQATTASLVVDLPVDAPPRAWACLGSPCVGVYVPFFPPVVPTVLSDPAQWQRFARLRDQVEAEPDAVARIRDVLAPVEHELWADADEAFAEGTHAPRHAHTARATRQVDAALTILGV